ncbi:hypothetical protein Hanom_Chr10g00884621 [Helianthus anomalus]
MKSFEFESLWYQFCCHFHPKLKSGQIHKFTSLSSSNMIVMLVVTSQLGIIIARLQDWGPTSSGGSKIHAKR